MTIEQRVAKLKRWTLRAVWACLIFVAVLCGLLASGFHDSIGVSPVLDWFLALLVLLMVVPCLALVFWRYRLSVHVIDRRRKLLNDAMKARLDELGQAARPPT